MCIARITESLATSNDDGTLGEVFTAPELSEALAHLHFGLWQELSFTRRDAASYVATERTPRGIAHGEFEHEGDRFERRRVTYDAAPGAAAPSGTLERSESTLRMRGETLESLEIDERFDGEGRLRVHLALSRLGDAPTPPDLELGASDLELLERLASRGAWSERNVEPLVRRLASARETHPASVRAVAQALIAAGHARGEVASVLYALSEA